MAFQKMIGGALALALSATSVAASAAPVAANPASSLSLSHARTGAPVSAKNKAAGGGLLAALIVAGVVAIGVIAVVKDDNSDSN